MTSETQDFFIGRQPILDRHQHLYAYELLFRSGQQNRAVISDDLAATATVLSHVFSEMGLEAALGPYLGFVNLDSKMLMSDVLEILPRDKFVLEVLETVDLTPEILERCRTLKESGFKLAIDDFVSLDEKNRPLLDIVDIVKVDILGMDQSTLVKVTESLRPWRITLLAEKVDSEQQAQQCKALGFDLFQGYYFAKPAIIAGKKLSQSEISLIRLLGMIMGDSETAEMESIFKQEPGLSLNLLRLTNSAATGVRQKITSLRHAITVLGRSQLQRWLQLLLYTLPTSSSPIPSALLQLAATRGRLMELLAGTMRRKSRDMEDHAFMIGIMSLMPALLNVPLEEIIKPLPLSPDVRDALENHNGLLGRMLLLVEELEKSDPVSCYELIKQLPGLSIESVNSSLTQAMTWANSIGRESP